MRCFQCLQVADWWGKREKERERVKEREDDDGENYRISSLQLFSNVFYWMPMQNEKNIKRKLKKSKEQTFSLQRSESSEKCRCFKFKMCPLCKFCYQKTSIFHHQNHSTAICRWRYMSASLESKMSENHAGWLRFSCPKILRNKSQNWFQGGCKMRPWERKLRDGQAEVVRTSSKKPSKFQKFSVKHSKVFSSSDFERKSRSFWVCHRLSTGLEEIARKWSPVVSLR